MHTVVGGPHSLLTFLARSQCSRSADLATDTCCFIFSHLSLYSSASADFLPAATVRSSALFFTAAASFSAWATSALAEFRASAVWPTCRHDRRFQLMYNQVMCYMQKCTHSLRQELPFVGIHTHPWKDIYTCCSWSRISCIHCYCRVH